MASKIILGIVKATDDTTVEILNATMIDSNVIGLVIIIEISKSKS